MIFMRTISEQKVGRSSGAFGWASRTMGLTRVLVGIMFSAIFYNPVQAIGTPLGLSLSWTYSSTNETGFGVQRATSTNGPWTQIGTVAAPTTSYLDTNLKYTTTYYYQTWAYNAAGNSPLSSMASFTTPPAFGVQLSVMPAGQFMLTVAGRTNHKYVIQATQNFITWTVIGTVTLGTNGSSNFTDTNAANFSRRFYRVEDMN
jgi:hypothetical protein